MAVDRIQDGVVVSLSYVLTVDGEEIARTEADETMEYLHGAENIVPGLEAALTGRSVGDKFSVTLAPADAYGDYDEENVEELDREDVPQADELEKGMVIEVEDEEGYVYLAYVREVNTDTVVLDYNPPLAGKTLTYDVEVMAVREAEEEELAHGHVHGMGHDYEDEDEDYEDYDDDEDEA
jgi:FKBP-type peptidyl-prolyl cis-trans isomerase SlyD